MHPPLHGIATGPSDKPVILFLHGFLGDHKEWADILPCFSSAYRCLAVDLPGHGRTASCGDASFYTFEGAAAAVVRFLNDHSVERASVVGYSMGGRLALYLGVRHPACCERLVLESSSPGLMSAEDAAARRAHDEKWAQRFERESLDVVIDDWYRQPLFATLHDHPAAYAAMRSRRLSNRPAELARSLRGMSVGVQEPLWDELSALCVDTVVMVGEKDRKYKVVAQRMSDLSDRIRTVMVPGAGHNAHVEQPDEFVRILRDALER